MDARSQLFDDALMDRLDQVLVDMGDGELAAKSRRLLLMGLASLAKDSNLKPTVYARWQQVRSLLTNDAPD
ncbi:MAG: hypothetical protein CMQ29_07345 [Gammaproteobacteria bacterium]|nr:hypothetical protein [Gammaproteobacteria bacterium]